MNLDSIEEFKLLDKSNVLESVKLYPEQIETAWKEVHALPQFSCSNTKRVVVAGMGGSALGGRIVDSLSYLVARAPIEVFTEYRLPFYVGPETFVILSSYSGNTEETVACAHDALKRGAQMFVIATGGKLADFARDNNIPSYIFEPTLNPAKQPRLASGYSIAAILAILAKCEFIALGDEEVKEAISTAKKFTKEFGPDTPESENIAKKMARELKDYSPVLVASEHLVGAAHAFKNQLNESAKTFSVLFDLPELNHHLMEGLKNPVKLKPHLCFVFFESELYGERVKIRYPITKTVVDKNNVRYVSFMLTSKTKLEQVFELLVFGSFVQFYLAMLYDLDPEPIPWVDFFKEELNKL